MEPILHRYTFSRFLRIFAYFFDALGFLAFIFLFGSPFYQAVSRHQAFTFPTILAYTLLALLVALVFLFIANVFTDITSAEDGLHVHFLLDQFDVPWEDVVSLGPLFNRETLDRIRIVRVRSLTPFHLIFGLALTGKFSPGIVYTRNIGSFDELNRRIQVAAKDNKRKPPLRHQMSS